MGHIMFVTGTIRPESMGVLIITQIRRVELQYAPIETLNPGRICCCTAEAYLSSLYKAVRSISNPNLKLFVGQVFADWRVASAFGQNPASSSHHHAFPGGLLIHSLEVAKRAWSFAKRQQEPMEFEVVVVLALLHDIGKILTFNGGNRSEQGQWQCTDMSALQVLNKALNSLDEYDAKTAHLIRSFYQPESWYPRSTHPVVIAVRNGDRGSLNVDEPHKASASCSRSDARTAWLSSIFRAIFSRPFSVKSKLSIPSSYGQARSSLCRQTSFESKRVMFVKSRLTR